MPRSTDVPGTGAAHRMSNQGGALLVSSPRSATSSCRRWNTMGCGCRAVMPGSFGWASWSAECQMLSGWPALDGDPPFRFDVVGFGIDRGTERTPARITVGSERYRLVMSVHRSFAQSDDGQPYCSPGRFRPRSATSRAPFRPPWFPAHVTMIALSAQSPSIALDITLLGLPRAGNVPRSPLTVTHVVKHESIRVVEPDTHM